MAGSAVARRGVSVALACRTFGVSETCYRYSPRLSDENERIGGLLVGLTHVVRPHSKLGGRTPIQIAAQRWLGHAPASVADNSNLEHQSTAGCYF